VREEQIRTRPVSIETIMTRKSFRLGFEDLRAGRPMRDLTAKLLGATDRHYRKVVNDQWDYERGRQFAIVASKDLQLFDDQGRLRDEAVDEYWEYTFALRELRPPRRPPPRWKPWSK
jgi:hypothetical protein